MRHPFLHYPGEQAFWPLSYQQYMIGSELWFAPVLDPGADEVTIRLPQGEWMHAFTGEVYASKGADQPLTVSAPIGTPAVLPRTRESSFVSTARSVTSRRKNEAGCVYCSQVKFLLLASHQISHSPCFP